MTHVTPVVTPEEVFAVSKKIRFMALTTDRGEVVYCKMRPGVESYSPSEFDEEFIKLGPLTSLGVAEKYSEYVKGVDSVIVWFGLVAMVYSRLGSQIISISIEKEIEAVSQFLTWLEKKRSELSKN